ncbi:MAG: (d)CMP kinase [Candidatus Methylomirabilis sp.]|nr:(d)CMP kinase [Candidatus Methylomirabilis sp.]
MRQITNYDPLPSTIGRLIIAIDGPVGDRQKYGGSPARQAVGVPVYRQRGDVSRAVMEGAAEGLDLNDERALRQLADETSIVLEAAGDRELILVDGQDVSHQIRERGVEQATSKISTHPSVRQVMVAHQRRMAVEGGVVMDGRDIGTVVFPDADLKFYLTARLEVRARRRYVDAQALGAVREMDELVKDIEARDVRDMNRHASPLRKADGAVTIDTSDLPIAEVVDAMEAEIQRKMGIHEDKT